MPEKERMSSRPTHKSKRLRAHVDFNEMTVKYGRVKLGVPTGFKQCLENVTREVLREQPSDIPAFLACYFTSLSENQKSGIPLNNLVTERVVEVKKSCDEGIQKDEAVKEVASASIETQDIQEARAASVSNSQTEAGEQEQEQGQEQEPEAQKEPSSLSLEQMEAQKAEQEQTQEPSSLSLEQMEAQKSEQTETQNLDQEESLPDLTNPTEEQQKAMDLLRSGCFLAKFFHFCTSSSCLEKFVKKATLLPCDIILC